MMVQTAALRGPVSQHRPYRRGKRIPEKILQFIKSYKRKHDGNSPSTLEIAAATGLTSTSVVMYYLYKLQDLGKIRLPGRGKARQIEVRGGQWSCNEEQGNAPIRVLPIDSHADQ